MICQSVGHRSRLEFYLTYFPDNQLFLFESFFLAYIFPLKMTMQKYTFPKYKRIKIYIFLYFFTLHVVGS